MTTAPATVAEALVAAQALGLDRLDAQHLLAQRLQRSRAWLLAHGDAALPSDQVQPLLQAMRRAAQGEPLAYVIGEQAFHGLTLQVTPAVLVPRPDTETLVDWALALLQGPLAALPAPEVADLGTGSGAIALAVKAAYPRARMRASDSSTAALGVARANARRLQLEVEFACGDWWTAFAAPPLHLALSNPPYIRADDPHLPALRHEPLAALVPPGADGLGALRSLVSGAPGRLRAGGWLLLEHGHDQGLAVADMFRARGWAEVQQRQDLGARTRCTGARWPGEQ